jgi:hypothetical protein
MSRHAGGEPLLGVSAVEVPATASAVPAAFGEVALPEPPAAAGPLANAGSAPTEAPQMQAITSDRARISRQI